MKATDLRIGNLVFDSDGNVCESDLITIMMSHNYKPIPLTEEWLVKFGFEKYYNAIGFSCPHYGMQILGSDFYFRPYYKGGFIWGWDRDEFIELNAVKQVAYVHKLQNLYFALTGEELTLK